MANYEKNIFLLDSRENRSYEEPRNRSSQSDNDEDYTGSQGSARTGTIDSKTGKRRPPSREAAAKGGRQSHSGGRSKQRNEDED